MSNEISILHIPSTQQQVDIFTKPQNLKDYGRL
jgi:hypothetical protein